jgi:glycosyltransferase involved in cell wall biosynthesis
LILKITLITVCYNAGKTIADTLESIARQTHPDIEYIIVDGASKDDTLDIIQRHRVKVARLVSEPDSGLYDAMNKGLKMATGEFIGFLHADDVFADNGVLELVANVGSDASVNVILGDVKFVAASDPTKVVRYYKAQSFTPEKLPRGIMPPHPGSYIRRSACVDVGPYDLDYKLSADFDYFVRLFHVKGYKPHIIASTFVHFRTGGASSSLGAMWKMYREVVRSCKAHKLDSGYLRVATKYPEKAMQFFERS